MGSRVSLSTARTSGISEHKVSDVMAETKGIGAVFFEQYVPRSVISANVRLALR